MEEDNDSNNSENMDDSDEDFNGSQPSSSHNRINIVQQKPDKDLDLVRPKQKRKRKEGRRRIRKILSQEQLDSETVSAQKEEQERLRRLELQKSLNTVSSLTAARSTPPSDKSTLSLDTAKVPDQPVLVTVPKKVTDAIIVIDDSDDDCDVVEASRSTSDSVIEISDSESELTDEDDEADVEPENSGSHTNDDVNQLDVQGRVLVNVNHPPSEPDIFLTSHLCTTVKPHQIGGIRFLYDNLVESLSRYQVSPGFGCILAHSMGLGKTLQVICFIDIFLKYTKATKVLCIVPMNTIQNWYNEFNAWLPEASSNKPAEQQAAGETSMEGDAVHERPGRKFQVLLFSDSVKTTVARSALIAKWEKHGGVLLMGYEMYRILAMYTPSLVNNTKLTGSKRKRTNASTTEIIDLDEEEKNMDLLLEIQKRLCKPGPDLVVCDEGHRIKNSQANISQALKKIHTRRRVVLTGYPLQNNLMEYWCMVDFVRPNFLGTKHEFSNMFERPIVNGQCVDSTASDIKLMRFRAHVLHSLLEGFVQRRSEAVLTKTLPEKEEYVIPVKMTAVQISLYQAFVNSVKNYVGYINPIKAFGMCIKIWNHPDILKSYLDSKKDANRNDSPLTACDPDLDIGVSVSKKTKDAKSDTKSTSTSSEPTLAPPDLRAVTNDSDWFGNLMDDYKLGVLQHGAKMVLLTEIIDKSVQMGDKILVFSQSLSTLSIIEEFLGKRVVPPLPSQLIFQPVHWERNKNYYRLDGGTSSQEREKLISAFNSKSNHSVFLFLLSTRACSLGVNLIGANRVVIFDASWNPCHDAQAVCRIYRYGQTKKCFIYRLVSHGTFEKRMYERQVTKEGMSDRVIDELNPEANLTKQEVMHLFKEAGTDEDEDDPDIPANFFPDPVLNHVCETCRKSIFEIPFKHKLQSSHKPRNILTKAEKREAKKGYEREKRAIDSANKYNTTSTFCSPQIREQMRKEVTNRPIGHVKPIPNVHANSSSIVRPLLSSLPEPLQPPVNPFAPNLPSMAFLSGLTFPPLLNNRFYQMGELRPLSPYPGNFPMPYPIPNVQDTSMEQANTRQPVMIDLMALPEDRRDLGDARKVEDKNVSTKAGKGDDQVNVSSIGKVGGTEVLQPQSLCDTSSNLTRAPCDVPQSTAGATKLSEPLVVSDSGSVGKLREIGKNIIAVSESCLQLPVVKSNANDREKPSSLINGVVGRIANADVSALVNNGCRMKNTGLPKDALIAANIDLQSANPSKGTSNTDEQYPDKLQTTAVSSETVALTGKSETSSYQAGPSDENLALFTSESPTKSAANVPLGVDKN